MKRIFFPSILAILVFSSCHYMSDKKIRGNGNIKTESRSAGRITGVDVSGSIDVYVKNDSLPSAKVEADENLLQYIEVIDDNGILRIHPREGYNPSGSKKIKVYVSSPDINDFEASGSCSIISENRLSSVSAVKIDMSGTCDFQADLKCPRISADLSGACDLDIRGETKDFTVSGSGSTHVKSMDLLAENVDIDLSGAGSASVFASVKLNIESSGSSSIQYKGNPAVSQSISGAGSVRKID